MPEQGSRGTVQLGTALAEDLEHWLAGEPIAARPIGACGERPSGRVGSPSSPGLGGGRARPDRQCHWHDVRSDRGGEATERADDCAKEAERERDAAEAARAETVIARDGERRAKIAAEKARNDEAKPVQPQNPRGTNSP